MDADPQRQQDSMDAAEPPPHGKPPRIGPDDNPNIDATFSVCYTNSNSRGSDVVPSVLTEEVMDQGAASSQQAIVPWVVDWESMHISEIQEDEFGYVGPLIGEDEIYELVGLRDRDEANDGGARDGHEYGNEDIDGHGNEAIDGHGNEANDARDADDFDIEGPCSQVNDVVPGEEDVQYDKENPPMTVGSSYPNMVEFRLALRQHAIMGQFEVVTKKAECNRFRGSCKAMGCPWAIVARLSRDGKSVRVTVNKFEHKCASTGRIQSSMASYHWVAEKAAPFLKQHPNMGPKELQEKLEQKYNAETTDNWTWFMQQLKKAVGDPPYLAISSDACKGLETAVKAVYPWAEHRECFRHLMDNFVKKFHGPVFRNMYPAARSYTEDRWQHYMDRIYEASPTVQAWLAKYHSLLWMRCKFSEHIKCDYVTNNLAEVWNNWVRDIKDLPVAELADTIRAMTMQLYAKRRRIADRLQGEMLPVVVKQLNAQIRALSNLKVTPAGKDIAEVSEINEDLEVFRHVVHLGRHECTCRQWQVTGKPCPHALAFITTHRNHNMEDFLHPYFSLRCFKLAYAGVIQPLTDKSQWPRVELGFKVLPPIGKRSVGRQRKKRIQGCLDKGKGKWKVTCKRCGELGHRQTSAKCPLNGTKKRKRTAKPGRPQGEGTNTPKRQKKSMTSSPGPMTRRRLAMSSTFGEGTSQQVSTPSRTSAATKGKVGVSKKLTPKKKK